MAASCPRPTMRSPLVPKACLRPKAPQIPWPHPRPCPLAVSTAELVGRWRTAGPAGPGVAVRRKMPA